MMPPPSDRERTGMDDLSPNAIFTAVGGAFTFAGGWVVKLITGRIAKAETSIAVGLKRVEDRASAEIKRVETAADESFRDVWNEIAQHRAEAAHFREKMTQDVARLPTREEMERMIARVAGQK